VRSSAKPVGQGGAAADHVGDGVQGAYLVEVDVVGGDAVDLGLRVGQALEDRDGGPALRARAFEQNAQVAPTAVWRVVDQRFHLGFESAQAAAGHRVGAYSHGSAGHRVHG
jgi:hypothetical protein